MKKIILFLNLVLCALYAGAALPQLSDTMGLVSIPVASMRTSGAHSAEMSTQAVMGTPIVIIQQKGDWYEAVTPEGYVAWIPESSVALRTPEDMAAWRANDNRYIVSELWQTHAFTTPEAKGPREIISDLVLGSIVEGDPDSKPVGNRIKIVLPDGRHGWADKSSLTPIKDWASQDFDAQKILTTAYSMEGSPYLWGGTSIKSVDCSGLVKVSYLNNGLILKRDASQQARTGTRLEADAWRSYQPGDLLFFGNAEKQKVTHVGIYDSNGNYVHSSGRVKRNSLDPKSPSYLYSPLWSVRINGNQGSEGITRAINHPWYFTPSNL